MKKSTLIMILSLMLAVALGVGGTLAYLQDTDEDVNVMTLGSVYITQNEQERVDAEKLPTEDNLKEFEQKKDLYPAVFKDSSIPYDADSYAQNDDWKVVEYNENIVDKFVTVTNTGKSDAYVRTIVAYEGDADHGPEGDFIHVVHNGDNEKLTTPIDVELVGNVTINEVEYTAYVYTYAEALAPGETSIPSLKQVYMNKNAGNKEMEYYGEEYDICVLSQAVQTQGFADATTALNTAFGVINQVNVQEWFANIGKNIGSPGDKWLNNNPPAKFTGDPAELYKLLSEASDAGSGDVTIDLTENYDMTGYDWKSIKVDGYHGADIVTVNGNGNYIKGLNAPLYSSGFAGGCGIVINDLTIMDSDIVSKNTIGSGAFVEAADSMAKISLDNCHLVNSTVTGGAGSRTGGLIGWTAGYNNQNDGPVKTYVEIRNCSVINCEITCDGSVGGLYGHAGNNPWTYSTVENCIVKDCKLTSTDDGGWRVGVVVGTANEGEMTINNITESGNTLTQTGKTAPEGQSNLYGRYVPNATGKLVIDGVEIN